MPTATTSAELPAAPEQVWAVISDFSRYGEWNDTHTDFPQGIPELAEGASFAENVLIMGMPGQIRWTVSEVDAPNTLRLDGAGPMGITLDQAVRLTGRGSGTEVTLETTFAGGPLTGPMGDAVAAAGRKAAAASLDKLAALF